MVMGLAYAAEVHNSDPVPYNGLVVRAGKGFESRATYCPPSIPESHDKTQVALTAVGKSEVPVSVEAAATPTPEPTPTVAGDSSVEESPSPTESAQSPTPEPSPQKPHQVAPGRARFESSGDGRAVNVVGYGGAVAATAVMKSSSGSGATGCSPDAARHWYFAEGSSDLGYDERLILYNPFPDEAVVRVSFVTPKGTVSKANLSDQAVASGSTSTLRLNGFTLKEPLLSVQVDAIRGRVVAWRSLQAHAAKRPEGEQLTLGATNSHTDWFLPDGATGDGYDERIAVLNPNDQAARVTISVLTSSQTLQPPKLLDITVPPASSKSIAPAAAVGRCKGTVCGMGAVVTSTNGIGVVVERTIWYSTSRMQGVASEVASPRTSLHWYLGPASFDPTRDSVVILNPTTADASVSLTLETDAHGPRSPGSLQHIKVKAGTRAVVPINDWTAGKPFVVLLSSTQQVVAERFSYSRSAQDASAVMGRPLR
jgi:hypothetical protein